MKQLVQDLRTREVRLEEVPPPCCLPGGLLVRNVASFISSGTERAAIRLGRRTLLGKALERPDLVRQLLRRLRTNGVADMVATVRARLDTSLPLGYSSAGVVVEVGAGAEEFSAGDRVACAGVGHANHADVIGVPKNLCLKIPPEVDFEAGASVALGAIALQGLRVAEAQIGERVAVVGLGLVGLLSVQVLKAAGCVVWGLDPDPDRVKLARELGADYACENRQWEDSPWSGACRRGEGADVVMLTAATRSSEPIELAGRLARDRGVVVVVGDVRVEIPRELYYKKELQVRYSRSYGPGRYDPQYETRGLDYPYGFVRWTEKRNMEAYLQLVAAGKVCVGPLITHRFSIHEAGEAYRLLSGERDERYVGILLTYPHAGPAPKRINVPARALRPRPAKRSRESVWVGWIGAGSFSRAKLLPALRKLRGVEFAGLANATGISAKRAAADFGFRYCSTDPNEILNDPEIDAVFIGTRHDLHAPLVITALERGKHVFVEKPLCLDEAELNQIAEAHAGAGRILSVGFNRRFSPFARECRKFFEERREPLSILYRVNAGRPPSTHWIHEPEQGGRAAGEICHFVDLVQYLTASLPVDLQTWRVRGADSRPEENLHIQIPMADGSRAQILYLSSGDESVPKERVEVFGRRRTAICDDFRKFHFYHDGRRRSIRLFRQDKGHREEMRAFIEAVTREAESPIPFESLRATTLATFRIQESSRIRPRGAEDTPTASSVTLWE